MTRRRALVTGANGGIGSVICRRLRADGVAVKTIGFVEPADVVLDLTADPMPEWDADDIDICIAVAGVVDTFAPAHLMSAEQWSRDIGVNLTGAFRVIQACLPGMRERRFGRIVAIFEHGCTDGSGGQSCLRRVQGRPAQHDPHYRYRELRSWNHSESRAPGHHRHAEVEGVAQGDGPTAGRLPFVDSLVRGLLIAADHRYRDAVAAEPKPVMPRSIRVAVDIIEADAEQPLTVTALATRSCISVRALQDGFRRHLGVSPMMYLRQVRLHRAHAMLQQSDPSVATVTSIAHRWGFGHVGRFAEAHAARYGETPATTLRRTARPTSV
jgi:AraC-like DNA-binding protein